MKGTRALRFRITPILFRPFLIKEVGMRHDLVAKFPVKLWSLGSSHGWVEPRPIARHLPAGFGLCLTECFELSPQLMVISNRYSRNVKTVKNSSIELN